MLAGWQGGRVPTFSLSPEQGHCSFNPSSIVFFFSQSQMYLSYLRLPPDSVFNQFKILNERRERLTLNFSSSQSQFFLKLEYCEVILKQII